MDLSENGSFPLFSITVTTYSSNLVLVLLDKENFVTRSTFDGFIKWESSNNLSDTWLPEARIFQGFNPLTNETYDFNFLIS